MRVRFAVDLPFCVFEEVMCRDVWTGGDRETAARLYFDRAHRRSSAETGSRSCRARPWLRRSARCHEDLARSSLRVPPRSRRGHERTDRRDAMAPLTTHRLPIETQVSKWRRQPNGGLAIGASLMHPQHQWMCG